MAVVTGDVDVYCRAALAPDVVEALRSALSALGSVD
jgi:hypothetical protein